jgi:MFS family permease
MTVKELEITKFEQESARYYHHNFVAGLIHGIFFQMSAAFGSIHTVLPAFVTLLTPSPIAVGLMAAIQDFGEIIPQLFTAYLIEDKPRKKKYLLGVITVRWISWGLLAWLTFQYALTNPGLVLTVLILLFGLFSMAGGMGTVLYADIFARAIPAERRGRFTGTRQIGGFALAILAGWIVKVILDNETLLPYPTNYSLIFLLSTVTLAVAFTGLAMIREPVYPVRRQSESLTILLRRAAGLVKINRNFRYLLASRALLGVGIALAPFYVVYARQNIGGDGGVIGVFLAAQMIGAALSNILWAWLADTRGNKLVIIGTVASSGLASLLALVIPQDASTGYYALVFVLLGAMLSGLRLGYPNFILEMATPEMRATCVALHNTLIAPITLLPLVAGVLISQSSFVIVFGAHIVLIIIGLLVSFRLLDPRSNEAGACIT